MNNCIWCECLVCGNEFDLPVPDLLEEEDDTAIGDVFWCGACGSHDYECFWGMFAAGRSSDTIGEVLRTWREWANSYGSIRSKEQRR